MKQLVLVGILTGALAGVGYGQGAPQTPPDTTKKAAPAKSAARTAQATPAKAGQVLATITLKAAVKANNEPLPAGTYQVRLTDESPKPAPGASPDSEKWVEFVKGGKVMGREIASIMPNAEVKKLGEDKQAPPPAGTAKVQLLKEKQYYRVWINKGGQSYLVHLPPA